MQNKIRQELEQLSDEKYRIFSSGLLPKTDHVLGVRLPQLRRLALRLTKEDWRGFLRTAEEDSFEEIMLQGMVIGYADCEPEERFRLIQTFVPKIDNWSVCDSFCSGLKFVKKYREQTWIFLQPYLTSKKEFEVRFAVVMLLFYFIDESRLSDVFRILDAVQNDGYYVKMAVAWAVSICFVRFPKETMTYLSDNHLDDVTYNKALQKITESLQVNKETKSRIRAMKRKV
ncbi:DNA alkylation repair protein [Caproiciproducens sp. CPB-2]|uniref:DNA alkylation repair protein n=1 Tax=Caproiciproducens sp. CPB-2 TaxID=3030017 RepID=UPI0023DC5AE4|nr:DNA alkylation repair protein [Caproiciproducens sp. CPB-2]MDF1493181.1 DNA alkylation repair protein [Caproiciproducens sp. CPB-2]